MIESLQARKVFIVMVGLPARGKTFMARKVARYLSWLGYRARVFNVGTYRRDRLGAKQPHTFFDPSNLDAMEARMKTASAALDDALSWLENNGDVVIYDATNSTRERREMILHRVASRNIDALLLESVCRDESVIEANIRATKMHSPDYAGTDADEAVRDFRQRIEHYERSYEEVGEDEGPFVKIIDVGRTVVAHRIEGYLQARLVYFLSNLHIEARKIWLTRHGESEYNRQNRIGGDSPLSPPGREYAQNLARFVRETIEPAGPLAVWTSTMRRTIETAEPIGLPITQWRALDEIDAGICDGMRYQDIAAAMPDEYAARKADKFRYRYPRGESYKDVIRRLEPVIMALERTRESVLIIAHQAVVRALFAYLMDRPAETCPSLNVPLHALLALTPTAYGCTAESFTLGREPALGTSLHETES